MFVDFNSLPATSRFWLFTADRLLTSEEQSNLNAELITFVKQWTAHKQDLNASFKIIEDSILIIAVDESSTGASGCSIDSMTKQIFKIAQSLNIDFINRFSVVVKSSNGNKIINANQIKSLLQSNEINEDTLVSNSMLNDFSHLNNQLFKPLKDTWMSRYLDK